MVADRHCGKAGVLWALTADVDGDGTLGVVAVESGTRNKTYPDDCVAAYSLRGP
jgi:hypothetical protein